MTLLERDIEDYLVERVKQLGGEVRKVKWIGRRNAPDRRVMLPPRVRSGVLFVDKATREERCCWVELKKPGYKVTPRVRAQRREHERMRSHGERVEVIDSIEGVDALLA